MTKHLYTEAIEYPEYELRHPSGEVDEFEDIGDAIDFRDNNGFTNAALFRRMVTRIIVKHEWEEIEQAVRSRLKVGDRVEFSALKPEWRDGTVAGVDPLRVRADDTDNLTTEPAAVRLLPDTGPARGEQAE